MQEVLALQNDACACSSCSYMVFMTISTLRAPRQTRQVTIRWLMSHVYGDPAILAGVRAEVEELLAKKAWIGAEQDRPCRIGAQFQESAEHSTSHSLGFGVFVP